MVVVAVLWFIFCLKVSFQLACQLDEFEQENKELDKVKFRKTAGMVRSVVRDELNRRGH